MTKQEYADFEQAVADFFKQEKIRSIHPKVNGEDPIEPYFSWTPCLCCRRLVGGDRYDCNGYAPASREVKEYAGVCPDCVYYAEYGRLDDATMAELT